MKPVSYDSALAEAKLAHAEKRYEDALRHFRDASLHLPKNSPISQKIAILDFQCATLVKLKRLDDALEAAKSIVRLDKSNARGYLRAASIEKLRDNLDRAIKLLDHGYSRVSPADMLYANLIAQRAELRDLSVQALVYARATDPMGVLPLEILQHVLSYLDFRELISLLRVCKTWMRILSQLKPVINTIDFRGAHKQVSQLAFRACTRRAVRPELVAIEKLMPATATVLSKRLGLWSHWISLTHLVLNDRNITPQSIRFDKLNLKTLYMGLEMSMKIEEVCSVLSTCLSLHSATFRRVGNGQPKTVPLHEALETLELGNAFDLSAFPLIPEWLASFPNLKSLTLSGLALSPRSSWDLRCNQKLIKLDTYACMIRRIWLPPSLEQWLWDGAEVQSFTADPSAYADTPLPNLHTLCLSGDNTWAVMKSLNLSQRMPGQLRRVGLHHHQSGVLWTQTSASEISKLGDVEEFSFESETLVDDHAEGFATKFPAIKVLQLAAPRITGAFVADLLRTKGNQIRKLILKDCAKVSPDTIDWVRARGVTIEIHRGKIEVRGGRRMREGWF